LGRPIDGAEELGIVEPFAAQTEEVAHGGEDRLLSQEPGRFEPEQKTVVPIDPHVEPIPGFQRVPEGGESFQVLGR